MLQKEQKLKEGIRNSNHELLRMIAMYMIVFVHASMYADLFYSDNIRGFFNGIANGICNIGVSCFVLISGYYGIRFSIKKLVKMECMMITYSLLETVILCMAFPEQMVGAVLLEQLVKSFLPFITRKYWFYSCYVCVFLLSGYIQKFINCLKQKEFERFLILLVVLFSVLPTLFYFELVPDNGKGFVYMIMIYMIGRYIRIYKDIHIPVRKAALIFVILWIVNAVSHEFPIVVGNVCHRLCKDNSTTNLIMAIILFYCFKNMTFYSKTINRAAQYIFAVFALNNTLVHVIMKCVQKMGIKPLENIGGFFILSGIVLFILAACLLTGRVREGLFGRLDLRIGKWIEWLIMKVNLKHFMDGLE